MKFLYPIILVILLAACKGEQKKTIELKAQLLNFVKDSLRNLNQRQFVLIKIDTTDKIYNVSIKAIIHGGRPGGYHLKPIIDTFHKLIFFIPNTSEYRNYMNNVISTSATIDRFKDKKLFFYNGRYIYILAINRKTNDIISIQRRFEIAPNAIESSSFNPKTGEVHDEFRENKWF